MAPESEIAIALLGLGVTDSLRRVDSGQDGVCQNIL